MEKLFKGGSGGRERLVITHPLIGTVDVATVKGAALTDVMGHLGVLRQPGEPDAALRKRLLTSLEATKRFVPLTSLDPREREERMRHKADIERNRLGHKKATETELASDKLHRATTALKDIGAIVRLIEAHIAPGDHNAYLRDIKKALLHGLKGPTVNEDVAAGRTTGFLAGLDEID